MEPGCGKSLFAQEAADQFLCFLGQRTARALIGGRCFDCSVLFSLIDGKPCVFEGWVVPVRKLRAGYSDVPGVSPAVVASILLGVGGSTDDEVKRDSEFFDSCAENSMRA
jgi:hypothetical protein